MVQYPQSSVHVVHGEGEAVALQQQRLMRHHLGVALVECLAHGLGQVVDFPKGTSLNLDRQEQHSGTGYTRKHQQQ